MLRLVCLLSVAVCATADVDPFALLANFQNLESLILDSAHATELPVAEKVTVTTQDGTLIVDRMEANGSSWLRARGIQYAEHPIGSLRWQPPVPKKPDHRQAADATKWGDNCAQGPFLNRLEGIKFASMSEACLYLNVWAPDDVTNANGKPKPVLVWFHGGSFTFGGTTAYDAAGILSHRQDAIIVTANYRLGALGFLGGKAISKSTVDGSFGNFGLQDTREALNWVQRNIASFGGDPHSVTIFGESAGASIVETHLSARRSDGLFQNAIMQSGAFDNYTVQPDPDANFAAFASIAGCQPEADNVMECLRNVPLYAAHLSQGLMPAIAYLSEEGAFGPTVDFVELTESPEASARNHRLNNLSSAIIGTNLNEGNFLMPIMMPVNNGPTATKADLTAWLQLYYESAPEAIAKHYAAALDKLTPWETASLIYTDSQYFCPTQRSARWLAETGADTFVYRLEYQPSIFDAVGRIVFQTSWCADFSRCDNVSKANPGVGHSADVSLLFNDPRMNATDFGVAHTFVDYWLNFAGSGNPSTGSGKVPTWPTFSTSNTTLQLGLKPVATENLGQTDCDFWAKISSGWVPPPHAKRAQQRLPIVV